jgi:hypothetical protein
MGRIEVTLCPTRPMEAPLEQEGRSFGMISRDPLSSHPQDPAELIRTLPTSDQPLYLEPQGSRVCAYPLRLAEPDGFEPEKIWAKNFRNGPWGFGIPTQIKSPAELLSGTIYDPARNFYYHQGEGLKWYLGGDTRHYLDFHGAVHRYAVLLESLWEKNPLALFARPSGLDEAPPVPHAVPHEEASKLMSRFFDWLRDNEPDLHQEVEGRVAFQSSPPSPPLLESMFCRNNFLESAYAYFDSKTSQIFLLPPTLPWLKAGDFESVAQVLAHEAAHRKVIESGLVMPTPELLGRSLSLFIQNRIEANFFEGLLFTLFGSVLGQAAHCNLMPMIPEEEVQAHAKEVSYAFTRAHGRIDADMVDEALTGTQRLWGHLFRHFPPEWLAFSAEYLFLAGEQRSSWMEKSSRAREIFEWFRLDFKAWRDCADEQIDYCELPSPWLKDLKEMSKRHRRALRTEGPRR